MSALANIEKTINDDITMRKYSAFVFDIDGVMLLACQPDYKVTNHGDITLFPVDSNKVAYVYVPYTMSHAHVNNAYGLTLCSISAGLHELYEAIAPAEGYIFKQGGIGTGPKTYQVGQIRMTLVHKPTEVQVACAIGPTRFPWASEASCGDAWIADPKVSMDRRNRSDAAIREWCNINPNDSACSCYNPDFSTTIADYDTLTPAAKEFARSQAHCLNAQCRVYGILPPSLSGRACNIDLMSCNQQLVVDTSSTANNIAMTCGVQKTRESVPPAPPAPPATTTPLPNYSAPSDVVPPPTLPPAATEPKQSPAASYKPKTNDTKKTTTTPTTPPAENPLNAIKNKDASASADSDDEEGSTTMYWIIGAVVLLILIVFIVVMVSGERDGGARFYSEFFTDVVSNLKNVLA